MTMTRVAPAIAQGAKTPNTTLAFEQAKANWRYQRLARLLDDLVDSDDQLELPFNTLLA